MFNWIVIFSKRKMNAIGRKITISASDSHIDKRSVDKI